MKTIILKGFGGVENLSLTDTPVPTPEQDHVLVQVKAISINPVDIKTRAGKGVSGRLKDIHPIILGWDIAGTVKQSNSPKFKPGDEVFGMINFPGHGKAYAEYVDAPASHLALKPNNITFEEAAAATLAALTAYQTVALHAKIKKGDRVFIHAAAGGVGHYAVQIAKHLGAYVIGTASADNADFVKSLGVDEHIDYKAQPFETAVQEKVDFVLDTIGGDNIDRSLEIIKPGGTIISIPSGLREEVTAKAQAKGINGYFTMVQSNGEDMAAIAKLLSDQTLISHISQTFPFEEMAKAHLQLETGRTRGKIIIKI
ncbi:MAG: NADP-dependent oxidoreductase [Bacteroidetes bacterium]|nr:NADP-dependent oxidoreductase [Bacteroidota bacterium]